MWRNSLSFSSKLVTSSRKVHPSPSSSLSSAAENGVVRSLSHSLPSPSPSPSVEESVKLGFQRSSYGVREASGAAVDFSSLAVSKARDASDLARHYGRCYWDLSKARLRNVGTNNDFPLNPDVRYLVRLIQSCNTHHFIHQGKQLHLLFLKNGLLECDVTIGNRLLQMYVRCSIMSDAHALFEEMPLRNCFSWNTMIEGYMKSGDCMKSLELFKSMPERNEFSWNVIITGFTKMGWLDTARSLFDEMPWKNGVAWTSIIHGYAQNGHKKDALRLFKHLSSNTLDVSYGDKFVLATVIGVCTDLVALGCGKQIHARIVIDKVEVDSALASSLINFYGKCGDLDSANHVLSITKEPDDYSQSALIVSYAKFGRMSDARRIFNLKNNPSCALWNSIISGYVCNNENLAALIIFNEMRANGVQGDFLTLVSVLSACSILGILLHAKQLHTRACKVGMIFDIIVAGSLLDAYSKCGGLDDACKLFSELKAFDTILLNCMITVYSNSGRIEEAKQIFKKMPMKSLISWNSMIAGLCQNGCPIEALDLFQEMNKLDLKMDKFSLASAISACAGISSLEFGEQVFARAIIIGLECDEIISSSVLDFYCKCGLVENGRKVFDRMVKCDEVPWNSMLMGYATNGHGLEALELFNEMLQAGVTPNAITFTGVLSACDHCGLIKEGRRWFYTMKSDYHIAPCIEHYACMIDLFSRAGCIDEAKNMIEQMPFKADVSMLSSVLRGCMATGDKTFGKKMAEQIIELDSANSGAYVQLSNIFASYGEWEGSAEVRKLMRHKGIQKNPGCSWSDC
ncbi:Tetratricopeptide-like helical domain containing protein [Trema orientale]|uniref:Tetratricopeptide-like helical domain containing protein n=1 Tax=Trema orientale TaxID=63057 RepID=A0A2P5EPU4_TREOI|nr:Tetratricopeptide-like helical domain containing protein [Trema orientale]